MLPLSLTIFVSYPPWYCLGRGALLSRNLGGSRKKEKKKIIRLFECAFCQLPFLVTIVIMPISFGIIVDVVLF